MPAMTPRVLALPETAAALVFSPDGRQLAVPTLAGPTLLASTVEAARPSELAPHRGGGLAAAFSPDGTRLATAGQDGAVRLFDPANGALLHERKGRGWAQALAFSPDGQRLAAAVGRSVQLCDREGVPGPEVPPAASTITALAWRPDGAVLFAAAYGGVAVIGDRGKLPPLLPWKGSLIALTLAPSGRALAAGSQEGSVEIWLLKERAHLEMGGYPAAVAQLAFSPDGTLLATGGGARIALWSFRGKGPEGKRPKLLAGHDEPLVCLVFHPDGTLFSLGGEGKLRRWSVRGGAPLEELDLGAPGCALALSPDGRHLAVATTDARLHLCAWT